MRCQSPNIFTPSASSLSGLARQDCEYSTCVNVHSISTERQGSKYGMTFKKFQGSSTPALSKFPENYLEILAFQQVPFLKY